MKGGGKVRQIPCKKKKEKECKGLDGRGVGVGGRDRKEEGER